MASDVDVAEMTAVLFAAAEVSGRDLVINVLSLLAGIGIGAVAGVQWAVRHPRGIGDDD